jgi:cytochrome c peroxidase
MVLVIFAPFARATAWADALVGETRRIQLAPEPAPAVDKLKAEYRRPETIPFPPDDLYTPEKAYLGRTLYYDTRLSGAGELACASCHNSGFGYGDGLATSIGYGMKPLDRRSPTVMNSAWGVLFMWDGRAASLEEQVVLPIQEPREMHQSLDGLVHILSAIPGYRPLFQAAFPGHAITSGSVADAIATYERTVVSAVAPFDAWIDGDEAAIPDAAKRGFALFNTKAQCALCHVGWRLTDDGFHDTGLPDDDEGRGRLLPHVDKMQHAFKTPGLREITERGPYMHDGALPTLEAVVGHYNQGGINRSSRSELVEPLGLSPNEQADIVAFLHTLTSAVSPPAIPEMPR